MKLFGTAGIRGITNKDITPEFALKIAMAYGSIFKGNIAVARDNRFGAEMIANAVISGLQATGNRVYNLGIVPLPIFARYVADYMDGGIMVTGSHTPPHMIGIIMVDSLGRDLYWDKSEEIEELYFRGKFSMEAWDHIEDSVWEDAIENYMRFIGRMAGDIGGYRIAIDPANGAAAGIIDRILESLGVEVYCINCERKKIPNRPSEPRRENLRELAKISSNFDLGAATDVDADRVLFASKGEVLSEDLIGAIFAENFGAEKIVTPINSSSLIEFVAEKRGFEVIYCPVGPPEIAEAIIRNKASFGYEETGKYIFPPYTLWGDSILSIVNLLKIMDKEGSDLTELSRRYPKFYQVKEKIPVERKIKKDLVNKIGDYLEENPPQEVIKIIRVDGVKIIYPDGWLLIRASGTEDVVRIFSDAKSVKRARELVEWGKKLTRNFISSFSLLLR